MTIGIGMTMVMSTGITGMSTKGCRDYVTNKDMVCRGGSNSIAKYCNTFEILQYLLQNFRSFAILIAKLLKFCNRYCKTF